MATAAAGLVVGAVCAVIVATVGQAAAAEARVLAHIDDAGTRTIVVRDPTGEARLAAASVASIEQLSGVGWVLGVGPVVDVRNAYLGSAAVPVPARSYFGSLPPMVVVRGRSPAPGEALAGEAALASLGAYEASLGVTDGRNESTVVGSFSAQAPLAALERGILIRSVFAGGESLREIYVEAVEVEDVAALAAGLRAAAHAAAPDRLVIETPSELVRLRSVVGNELGANGRRLIALTLGVGLVIIAATISSAVALRRRDFGRRRALGASRGIIMTLVGVQVAAGAALGIASGLGAGLLVVWRSAGAVPRLDFMAAVGTLALLMALGAAVPPALLAALRDPVRILRVP